MMKTFGVSRCWEREREKIWRTKERRVSFIIVPLHKNNVEKNESLVASLKRKRERERERGGDRER